VPIHERFAVLAAALLVPAHASLAQLPVPAPKTSVDEALQLLAAAGFQMGKGTLLNLCGQPATPKITYTDLNGDGQPEAVAVDSNPSCYEAPGDWFTVVSKDRDGRWRAILRDSGVLTWEKTRTHGWVDARRSGAGRCDRIARFDGSGYLPSSDCVASAALTPAAKRDAAAPAPNDLTASERDAIFAAAGFTRKGRDWVGCDGNTTASIEQDDVRDINRDGKLDAVVTEMGSACYGNVGQGFHLLTREPAGWKRLHGSPGIPEFLKTSANGWPELEVGGPGFCFPILRWDGKSYAFHRNHEYESGACAQGGR
jgi:hypothetical protein